MNEIRSIEEYLLAHADLKIPVWFTMENSQVETLYNKIMSESSSSTDQTTLVIETKEASPLKKVELANIQGLLTGLTRPLAESSSEGSDAASADEGKIPTIAITANWDSYASVPGLATGANSDASGVVVLLQVARALSKLYANQRTQARVNVVFLLSSGSHLNYVGTRHWLDLSATGSAVRDSLEWVLSLDGLGQEGELFLHASRPAKDPKAAHLYDTFAEVAQRHNIPFSVQQKKINIAESTVAWEYELFARRKILSATLSNYASPAEKPGLFDKKDKINMQVLERNALFVAEVVTRLMYKQEKTAPSIVTSVNGTLSQGWLNALTSKPRMVPFADATHPIVEYLENTLKQYAGEVSRQAFKPDTDKVFFDGANSAKLTSYRTQTFMFDFILFLIVLAANAVLYTLVKGNVSEALADFGSLLGWIKGRFVPGSSSSSSSADKKKK